MNAACEIVRGVIGHATQDEFELTQAVSKVMELQPRTVIEIGVYRGGTLSAWAQSAADDALIIGVDLLDRTHMNIQLKPGQHLELVKGDSTQPGTIRMVRRLLGNRPTADFLFIDGLHEGHVVQQDFVNYSRMVRRGGLIGMHDVVGNGEVRSVWESIRLRFPDSHVFFRSDQPHRMGIGMVPIPTVGSRNLNGGKVGIAILTCRQPEWLELLLHSMDKAGWPPCPVRIFQDGIERSGDYFEIREKWKDNVKWHCLEPWGCIHKNAQFAFENTPEDWVWLLQDDDLIVPGYFENALQMLWDCEEVPAGELVGLLQPPYHQSVNLPSACPSRDEIDKDLDLLADVPRCDKWLPTDKRSNGEQPYLYLNVHGSNFIARRKLWEMIGGFHPGTWRYDEWISFKCWTQSPYVCAAFGGPSLVHGFPEERRQMGLPIAGLQSSWERAVGMSEQEADFVMRTQMQLRGGDFCSLWEVDR